MFLVIVNQNVTIKFLKNVRYFLNTRIHWTRYENRRRIIQCHRCQQWGHATTNCHAWPRCLKCAEQHQSKDCQIVSPIDKNTHKNIKCANCDGKHLANDLQCPINNYKIEQLDNKKTDAAANKTSRQYGNQQNNQQYIPAPIPQNNMWSRGNPLNRRPENPLINQTGSTHDDFKQLTNEFTELNKLIDTKKMVQLVRELNNRFRSCQSQLDKLLIFNQFFTENFSP